MRWFSVLPIGLCVALAAAAWAAPLTLRGGARQVSLLELYTSEGCSSCPPADRWLSGLKDDPRLWRQLVPVAFHVDYWDYLGWKDRFASPVYSARQRAYAESRLIRGVYTPGLILNGAEWRGWFLRPELRLETGEALGELTLQVDARQVQARFVTGQDAPGALRVQVAVLGFGLSTAVKDGENEGRTLTHDFVVLGYTEAPLTLTEAGYGARLDLPTAGAGAPRQALAAWVSAPNDPRPLQAVGGWLGGG
jgi:hypothetical protein